NSTGTTYGNEISFVHVSPGFAYQGGKVGYIFKPNDNGYVEGEVHGIIAYIEDIQPTLGFGCFGTDMSGSEGSAIGTGKDNTNSILAQCPAGGSPLIAARICDNLAFTEGTTTYDDWFLPSIGELMAIYPNRNLIGNFNAGLPLW